MPISQKNKVPLETDLSIFEVILAPTSTSCERFTIKVKGAISHKGVIIRGDEESIITLNSGDDLQLHADMFFKAVVEALKEKG